MLAGACAVFAEEGCALVGGHTAEGAEDALGFSCHGIVHPDRVLRKGPAKADHSLIVTKPLGTGAIMAAEMKGFAKGSWVHEAVQSMLMSNRRGADILRRRGCTACTDLTGFGLLGHLLEMMQYDDDDKSAAEPAVGVRLSLNSIPFLSGAHECIQNGIVSSLHSQVTRGYVPP
jgi:selenide,water dikinase